VSVVSCECKFLQSKSVVKWNRMFKDKLLTGGIIHNFFDATGIQANPVCHLRQ
jgi:hypothetical protein